MTTKTTNETKGEADNIEATLSVAREQIADLERRLRLARGTADVAKEAKAATTEAQGGTLAARVEATLRRRVMSFDELARTVDAPAGRVSAVLKQARGQVYNVGTETAPRWTWIVGDDTGTDVLYPLVERLLRERPLTFPELLAATGAREGRVSGAIVSLQQRPEIGIMNLGRPNRARWFVVPPTAKLAKLAKPTAKK